jgi:hypothetical protein
MSYMMGYGNWTSMGFGAGGVLGAGLGMFLFPLMIWSLAWKGWALWKAAKADSKVWFVVLLLVNTVGILDILYIYVFDKKPAKAVATKAKSRGRK